MKPPIEPYRSINGMNNLLMGLLDLCYYSDMLRCSCIGVKSPRQVFLNIGNVVPAQEVDKWNHSIQFKEDVKRGGETSPTS